MAIVAGAPITIMYKRDGYSNAQNALDVRVTEMMDGLFESDPTIWKIEETRGGNWTHAWAELKPIRKIPDKPA